MRDQSIEELPIGFERYGYTTGILEDKVNQVVWFVLQNKKVYTLDMATRKWTRQIDTILEHWSPGMIITPNNSLYIMSDNGVERRPIDLEIEKKKEIKR